jgi:hypothetical protein
MSLATIAGFGVDWLELDRPFSGAWILRARLDIGDDATPALGTFSCVFDDGTSTIEYNGTIIQSNDDTGDGYVIGVGGMGKLGTILPGVDYSQPQPRTVAKDIITACGETEGDLSGLDTLSRIEPAYSCINGRASKQLESLCKKLSNPDSIVRWLVTASGTIDIGVPQWPTYSGAPFVVHKPNAYGVVIAEPNIPDIEPGSIVDGIRIGRVRYYIDDNGLTAHLEVPNE